MKTTFDPKVVTIEQLILNYLRSRKDYERIVVEVQPLRNYIRSAEEHQDRLTRCPSDYCHIPKELLKKYKP